jgi:hypothetical protein
MEISGLYLDIVIGQFEVMRAPRWWIESVRHNPLGWAGVTLPDPNGELYAGIAAGDAISIRYGYRDQVPSEWTGTVTGRYPGETRDQVEIRAVDRSRALSTVRIKQAWENESPEAIVAWALRKARLPIGRIGVTGMVLPRFTAANIPIWELVRQVGQSCSRAFGLDVAKWALWLGAGGLNWGDFDEPGETVNIGSADNLIRHEPSDWASGMASIETFLVPGLSHSRLVHLQDHRRSIDAVYRALRVRHEGTPDRIRTFVWYGRENG